MTYLGLALKTLRQFWQQKRTFTPSYSTVCSLSTSSLVMSGHFSFFSPAMRTAGAKRSTRKMKMRMVIAPTVGADPRGPKRGIDLEDAGDAVYRRTLSAFHVHPHLRNRRPRLHSHPHRDP